MANQFPTATMSDYDYIFDLIHAYNEIFGRYRVLEERLRNPERSLGASELEKEHLKELIGRVWDHDGAGEEAEGDFEHDTWKQGEEGRSGEVILSRNPYVECGERREKCSCRADDGRYFPTTSSEPIFESHKPDATIKSESEAPEANDSKLFERSNAPSPDEIRYREQWREAVREQGRGGLRQIETEMAILDLIVRIEKLEGHLNVPERENLCSNVELGGGMGARDEDEEFVYEYGGYTYWDHIDATKAAKAQQQASRGESKISIPKGGNSTNFSASPCLFIQQATYQVGNVEMPVPQIRDGASEDIQEAIQRTTSVNLGLSEEFKSIYGRLVQETTTPCLAPSLSGNDCTDAWMDLATVLQTRNYFLERELQAFKEMNDSLVQDRNWQMGTQVELEEHLEAVQAERDDVSSELKALRKRLESLVVAAGEFEHQEVEWEGYRENTRFSGRTMRGGNEESELVPPEERNTGGGVILDSLDSSPTSSESSNNANDIYYSSQSSPRIINTSFDFFPNESTIVFGGEPPHIYQFPHKYTLPQIRELLESRNAKEKIRDEKYISRILEIMKIREDMGLKLPDNLREERVSIGLPDVSTVVQLDNSLGIAAWQTCDTDVKGLEKSVRKINIGSSIATGARENLPKTSFGDERDTYHDVSGLVNALDEADRDGDDQETESANFCACKSCIKDGRETYFNIRDMQPSPTVRVRGGGDNIHEDPSTPSFPLASPHLSPLLSSSPYSVPKARPIIQSPYGLGPSNDYEIATVKRPLSTRLSTRLFPHSLSRDCEDSVHRFNWHYSKSMNPHLKNECPQGFQYMKDSLRADWASQLDRHRAYCDYCQAVFIEEEYARERDVHVENIQHEDDVPVLNSEVGRPWEKSSWPDDTHNTPFPVVQDPDLRLRGGACHEQEMRSERKDMEDWKSEWHNLAIQARSTMHMSRTFRNSSTLSTKAQIQPMEPVVRDFRSRWRLMDGCFLDPVDADLHEGYEGVLNQEFLGESARFLNDYPCHSSSPDSLLRSKTKNPSLLKLRSPRGGKGLEGRQGRSRQSLASCCPHRRSSLNQNDGLSELMAEDWLENPRLAPLPAFHEGSSARKPSLHVHWHSDLSFSNDQVHHISHPSPPPSPPLSRQTPCKRCSQLFNLLLTSIIKLKQHMRLRKQAFTGSTSASTKYPPHALAPAQTNTPAFNIDTTLSFPSSSLKTNKSLPPTPHTSTETIMCPETPLIQRGKSTSAPPTCDLELRERTNSSSGAKLLERAYAMAKAKDAKCAEIVCSKGTEWWIPSIAGPVDLVREALMWLIWEEEVCKRELEVGTKSR